MTFGIGYNFKPMGNGSWQLAAGDWRLAIGDWNLATCDWQCLKVDSYSKKENSQVIDLSKQQ